MRVFVDDILNDVPDEVSDEEYDVIETAFLEFRKIFTKNLQPPNNGKTPSWYFIKNGAVILCEGYDNIPQFQGRENEIAKLIEDAVSD